MGKAKCSDEEFIKLFNELGGHELAKRLGGSPPNVYARRRRIERRYSTSLVSPNTSTDVGCYPKRQNLKIENGMVIIGSDAHYWPGIISTAHRGMVHLVREFGTDVVAAILNGDGYDFPRISRHPPLGWSKPPTVKEELAIVRERTDEIVEAAHDGCDFVWNFGNHDSRFEARLAGQASEFEGTPGFRLADHLPAWRFGWGLWINDDVVIKHRWKGGVHATHNNTLNSGRTMVTGHLHSLKVTPFSDYNGTRFGVDTGTLADPYGPQFDYDEDNPKNHRSGFIVLTFKDGKLLWPEIASVFAENVIQFRGKLLSV